MYQVIICDDHAYDADQVKIIVEKGFSCQDISIKIHQFQSPEQISPQILSHCDIAFLDIDYQNEKVNGMDLAKLIRQEREDAIIVFVTNHIEYAPAGYVVRAFRYVLKRDMQGDLPVIIREITQQLRNRRGVLQVSVNGEIVDIPLVELLYLEAVGHKIILHCVHRGTLRQNREYPAHLPLAYFEKELGGQGFLRIHKSFLVNMRYIKRYQSKAALLADGTVIRVSEKNYRANKEKYLSWKMQ